MGMYFSLQKYSALGFADTNTVSFLSSYTTRLASYNYQYSFYSRIIICYFCLSNKRTESCSPHKQDSCAWGNLPACTMGKILTALCEQAATVSHSGETSKAVLW